MHALEQLSYRVINAEATEHKSSRLDDHARELVALRREGATLQELADRFGASSRGDVWKWFRNRGLR